MHEWCLPHKSSCLLCGNHVTLCIKKNYEKERMLNHLIPVFAVNSVLPNLVMHG